MSVCACKETIVGSDISPSTGLPAQVLSFSEIGAEYLSLKFRLGVLMETQQQSWPGPEWTEDLEREWLEAVDPLRDRMAVLWWTAIKCPAYSLAALKVKATILMDLIDDDPKDASAQLSRSLCRDIIGLHEKTPA